MNVYEWNTNKQHPLGASGIKTSNKPRATGSVRLTDFTSMTLLSPQNRPSDPVSYTVDFDTSNLDLFMSSTNCNSACLGHENSIIHLLAPRRITWAPGLQLEACMSMDIRVN
ncbi:hypothetical protein F5888DRAFT_1763471 [Russula emetica]|nr:hypothetical protein F5888DRAFT_1763471 [Russula emetica]